MFQVAGSYPAFIGKFYKKISDIPKDVLKNSILDKIPVGWIAINKKLWLRTYKINEAKNKNT